MQEPGCLETTRRQRQFKQAEDNRYTRASRLAKDLVDTPKVERRMGQLCLLDKHQAEEVAVCLGLA